VLGGGEGNEENQLYSMIKKKVFRGGQSLEQSIQLLTQKEFP